MFSGVNCPGLIEGSVSLSFQLLLVASFPGLIAPASLKGQPGGQCAHPDRWFSGVNCPGLIEGTSGIDGQALIGERFPGLIAPASLKADRHGIRLDGRPVFRG